MVLYSIILFLVAIPMVCCSIAIYRGNTDLIHDYHQNKVRDKAAYGRAFGKAMFTLSLALLLSGIIALLGDPDTMAWIAVAVLLIGLLIGIGRIMTVQKKYNNGVF